MRIEVVGARHPGVGDHEDRAIEILLSHIAGGATRLECRPTERFIRGRWGAAERGRWAVPS